MQLLVLCLAAFVGANAQSFRPAPIRGHSGSFSSSGIRASGNPCSDSPCGPNTRCEVSNAGIARCRCVDGYVPDGDTINGCKPQCISDFECPDDYQCTAQKCERVCRPGACGQSADCEGRNHRAYCSCPDGFTGDGDNRCTRFVAQVRANNPIPFDPCQPSPCGDGADCKAQGDRPVCSCPFGFEGNPLTRCTKAECIETRECSPHLACQGQKCIDPCGIPAICGVGAECQVRNHQPVCSCGQGMTGDPFNACRRFDPRELCEPSPCGDNTNCRVENSRAVCSCIDNYIGDPLRGCRAECLQDSDCPFDKTCRQNRCSNPCAYNACAEGAYCEVRNNRVDCKCPQFFKGDPFSGGCRAECTRHDDCKSHQACFQLECVDPCVGACGSNAICKVKDHKPICSCPKDHTGHPFEACRPFTEADLCNPNPCGTEAQCTPGTDRSGDPRPVCTCPDTYIGNPLLSCQRGECTRPGDCGADQTCHAYQCQNACVTATGSVCGEAADCKVKNHQPVCSCPRGYTGNPLQACYPPGRI